MQLFEGINEIHSDKNKDESYKKRDEKRKLLEYG